MDEKEQAVNNLALREISEFARTARILMGQYTQAMEDIKRATLSGEALKEVLADHFEENSRWADELSKRMDRLERSVILDRVGNTRITNEIEKQVFDEHAARLLEESLLFQRNLYTKYQRNLNRVNNNIALAGVSASTALLNEAEEYTIKITEIEETINSIRESLKASGRGLSNGKS